MNKIKAKIQQTQETIKLSGIYHNYIYHDETLDGHGTAQDKLRISDTAQEKINQAIEYGQEIKTYSERIAHVETQSAEAQTNASQALAQVGNKQDRLTPGTNITIENNVISATGGETIKNQNTDSSITKTYDWVGTLQEAIDQDVRALHPDWKIYITDDVAGGDSVYTKNEVDEKFVNKSDTEYIAHQAMPSDRYTDLTLGGSGTTYTAPADGWFFIHKAGNNSGQYLTVTNRGQIGFDKFQHIGYDTTGYTQLTCFMPVKKGDVVSIGYSLGGRTYSFRFIYANGSK